MKNRLFIALKIPDEAIEMIVNERDKLYGKTEFRWEDNSKLHLTLKFLGDVDEKNTAAILNVLGRIAEENRAVDLWPDRYTFLFKFNEPKILWIGFNTGAGLSDIVENLENQLEPLGFQKENRSFKPHITLSRIKRSVRQETIDLFNNYRFKEYVIRCNEIALVKSELRREGSVYKDVKKFNLR
jgi:2'-5' RNA ligase